jgi:hypothetical protein
MPAPLELSVRNGRMYVEVAVIQVDVPAEQAGDDRQRCRVIDQLEKDRVVRQEPELVDGAAAQFGPGAIDRLPHGA